MKQMWVTEDGSQFDDRDDATQHERTLNRKKDIKQYIMEKCEFVDVLNWSAYDTAVFIVDHFPRLFQIMGSECSSSPADIQEITKEEAVAILGILGMTLSDLDSVFTDPAAPDMGDPVESGMTTLRAIARGGADVEDPS
jgi:hypothetical protein